MSGARGRAYGPTRRDLLRGGGVLLAGAAATAAAGCDALSTAPTGTKGKVEHTDRGSKGAEAPMLTSQVKAGKLPAVKDRLPKKPLVIHPTDRVGSYGGDWHDVVLGPANQVLLYMTIGYEQLVAWPPDFKDVVIPNIAESYDVGGDGSEYTFHLREGMKWSDGEPFGADDIDFLYNDILLYPDFESSVPFALTLGGKPPKFTKVNDHEITFTFPRPHGLFLEHMATPTGNVFTTTPSHYLKKFHKKYNPDADKLAKEKGFDRWVDLVYDRMDSWGNKELPQLLAWKVIEEYGSGGRMVVERNPYYFKTDPDGSQLPYIDKAEFEVVKNQEVILLKASNGELDMDFHYSNSLENKPVLARNRSKGDYHFIDTAPTAMNYIMISLNLTHEDKVLRNVFLQKDFRVGLSYAINRQEIIDTILQGQGEPWQASPRPESELSDRSLGKQYTEFSVAKANEHLDAAGFDRKNGSGIRLRPDGKPIFFSVEVAIASDLAIDSVGALEMVSRYWKKVGIDMQVKAEDRSLLYERKAANKHDANVWFDKMGLHDAVLDPRWYFPFNGESNYGIPWANWYVGGVEPKEEPPAPARKQMELYDKLQGTVSKDERAALFQQILDIAKDQFWAIGIVLPTQGFGIAKNEFFNVQQPMPDGWLYPTPGPSRPEQYFIGRSSA